MNEFAVFTQNLQNQSAVRFGDVAAPEVVVQLLGIEPGAEGVRQLSDALWQKRRVVNQRPEFALVGAGEQPRGTFAQGVSVFPAGDQAVQVHGHDQPDQRTALPVVAQQPPERPLVHGAGTLLCRIQPERGFERLLQADQREGGPGVSL